MPVLAALLLHLLLQDVECVPQHALQSLRGRSAFCYKALLVAMALALAGVGAWGLAGSIAATNDTFTELWDIVQAVNDKASGSQVFRVGGLALGAAEAWLGARAAMQPAHQ